MLAAASTGGEKSRTGDSSFEKLRIKLVLMFYFIIRKIIIIANKRQTNPKLFVGEDRPSSFHSFLFSFTKLL